MQLITNSEINRRSPTKIRLKRSRLDPKQRRPLYTGKRTRHYWYQISILSILLFLMTIAGIIIVYRKAPSYKNKICDMKFVRTPVDPIDYTTGPTSAAVGDLNNDRNTDLVITYSQIDSFEVYFGTGNGQFQNKTQYALEFGAIPSSVAIGDINNDHNLDVVIAKFGTHAIDIFLGSSDGSLVLYRSLSTNVSRPLLVKLDYFDSDRHLDLAVIAYGTQSIQIYYHISSTNLSKPVKLYTGEDSNPGSLCSGDLNDDGLVDIVVANAGTNTIGVFLQKNDTTFDAQIVYSTGYDSQPKSIAIGDFNQDGIEDIVVANFNKKSIMVLIGHENGTLALGYVYLLETLSPSVLTVANLNDDNLVDIVVVGQGADTLALFFGSEDGLFSIPRLYDMSSSKTLSVVVGRFSEDYVDDFAITNYEANKVDIFISEQLLFHDEEIVASQTAPLDLVVADFNHDTYPDILVLYQYFRLLFLYHGYGNGSFESPNLTILDETADSVSVADFNNDGNIDLLIRNHKRKMLNVYFGDGHGKFPNRTMQLIDIEPVAVAVGDFNNDTLMDIAAVSTSERLICILLGDGHGNFFKSQSVWTMNLPGAIVTADFNNDNSLDLAVTNRFGSMVSVYLGYSNGSFDSQMAYDTSVDTKQLAVGDFNSDGQIDLVVLNSFNEEIGVYLGYGNGTFMRKKSHPTMNGATFMIVMDANADGIDDVIVSFQNNNLVGIFLGNGDGTLRNHQNCSTSSGPRNLVSADFNMDNYTDIIVANVGAKNIGLFLYEYYYDFRKTSTLTSGSSSALKYLTGDDLNGDNQLDIVVTTFGAQDVGILFSNGQGNFTKQTMYKISEDRYNTAAIGDFNGDSLLDIVITGYEEKNCIILLGEGNETFNAQMSIGSNFDSPVLTIIAADLDRNNVSEAIITLESSELIFILIPSVVTHLRETMMSYVAVAPTRISIENLNDDLIPDLVVIGNENETIRIYLGVGDGSFIGGSSYSIGNGAIDSSVADINHDRILDIVIINFLNDTVSIFYGLGDGNFSYQLTLPTGVGPTSIAIKDMNHDNKLDLIISNLIDETISILLNDDENSFQTHIRVSTNDNPYWIIVDHFNNDNEWDIVFTSPIAENINILLGNGNLTFREPIVYETGATPYAMDAGDVDHNGFLDLIVSNSGDASLNVFLGLGNGTFRNGSILSSGSSPREVTVKDMNNDGHQDIVVLNQGNDSMGIYLGYGNGSFEKQQIFPAGSQPKTFGIGDLNNDSIYDVTVGNYMSNTVSIFLGHLNLVLKSNRTLNTTIESSKKILAIGDLNTDGRIDIAVAYPNVDQISVFFNEGNLSFSQEHLVSLGYSSTLSITSIAIADFNQDHRDDLLLTDTRQDSLVLLLSAGNGTFMKPIAISTGANSQPTSVLAFDFNLDGRLDVAFINTKANNVEVMLGYGNGSFSQQITAVIPFGSRPILFAVGDFNNDTRGDIAVLNTITDNINTFLQAC